MPAVRRSFMHLLFTASLAIPGAAFALGIGGGDDDPIGGGDDDDDPPSSEAPAIGDFVTFETGQVRPLALSDDGNRLYATNTPDNRVEVYDTSGSTPTHIESIPVGMEPVALALSGDGELWVVNHLSDSVSIVDVSASPARVTRTLLVADEPRDIVFAGPNRQWAFITAAHRGQNAPFDPQLDSEGVGRADVWVFNKNNPGEQLGGSPVDILNMFGDTTRALATSTDGTRVYAAVFNSGNRTSILTDDRGQGGIDKPSPINSADGERQPRTGLIVQYDGQNWVGPGDPTRNVEPQVWNDRMNLELPDLDVFTIDASGSQPEVVGETSGVGTTLFNMAVNPVSGNVYVSNTEADNLTRFEGEGTRSTTVRGDFIRNRITVIDNGSVNPRHLNKHIESYDQDVGTASERELSVHNPLQMAVSQDGSQLFLASMGTNKIVRYNTNALEGDSFEPRAETQAEVSGGGPTGVVLDEERNRAFVLTRFDNGISVVDTGSMNETAHVEMFNPEPSHVVEGRPFLYDAERTSSRGNVSCSGCHIFGDMDHLSWDLGNPDATVANNPNEYNENVPRFGRVGEFHPMKGPMTTQSLRGLKNHGPQHWRGDRTGQSADADESLEEQAFEDFDVAFDDLNALGNELPEEEMDTFAQFALELTYPPNPIRNLDNSLTPNQQQGRQLYMNENSDNVAECNGCHVIDREQGFFGSDGTMSIEGPGVAEDMKIPQLRNMYQKVGMFAENTQTDEPDLGRQIRGFGYDNSGASGTIEVFLSSAVFTFDEQQRDLVQDFVMAAPSNLFPIVGQQVTVNQTNANRQGVNDRVDLLVERAGMTDPAECELVAKQVRNGRTMGWVMNASGDMVPDNGSGSTSVDALIQQASSQEGNPVTFTCVPPGNGTRIGIDRDADGTRDANET